MAAREIVVDCINRSTVVSDSDFEYFLGVQQQELDNAYSQEWVPMHLGSSKLEAMPATAWEAVLLDDSDQAGAAGYHDLVTPAGTPRALSFARTDLQHGLNWTVTFGHEIYEMGGDPDINRTVMIQLRGGQVVFVAYETCDAVETDTFGRVVNGLLLSDFVMRRWFEPGSRGQMDAYGHLSRPLQIIQGGYIGVFVPGRGWSTASHLGQHDPHNHEMIWRTRHPQIENSPRRMARFSKNPPLHTDS